MGEEKITAFEAAKGSKDFYAKRIARWNRLINDFISGWIEDPFQEKDHIILYEDDLKICFDCDYSQYAKGMLENRGFIVRVSPGAVIEKTVFIFFKKKVYIPEKWEIINPLVRR